MKGAFNVERIFGKLLTQQQSMNDDQQTPQSDGLNRHTIEKLFDHYPDPVFILDQEGNIVSKNRAVSVHFEQDCKNIKDAGFILKENKHRALEHFNEVLRGKIQCYRSMTQDKNVQVDETMILLFPLFSEAKVEGVVSIIRYHSAAEQHDAACDHFAKNLNSGLAVADIGIWDYDLIEDEAFWSDKMYDIFGIDPAKDEVPTFEMVYDLVHPEDQEIYTAFYRQMIEERRSGKLEYRIVLRDGRVRTVTERADVILDENKQVVRLLGSTHVISK